MACHNPPTREEAVAGRPMRPGFRAAPPPGSATEALAGVPDELAEPAEWFAGSGDVDFVPGQGPTPSAVVRSGCPSTRRRR
jgi:hypothetical protein